MSGAERVLYYLASLAAAFVVAYLLGRAVGPSVGPADTGPGHPAHSSHGGAP